MEQSLAYPVKHFSGPTKRYCRCLGLADDPVLIERYCTCHDPSHHWKEIRDGIRQVGILEMEIYIFENRVFMIVETPLHFDWDSAMARLATLPRQQEWETHVALFQGCDPSQAASDKWHPMTRIFHLYP